MISAPPQPTEAPKELAEKFMNEQYPTETAIR